MPRILSLMLLCAATMLLTSCGSTQADRAIDLSHFSAGIIGQHTQFFQEHNGPLTLQQAQEHFLTNPTKSGRSQSIALGIGVKPVWLKFSVNNPTEVPVAMRMAIDTPWLDYIDTWLVTQDRVLFHIPGGDHLPYDQRPMPYRVYAFERDFPIGTADVYIRVESLGPMAIPINLSTTRAATSQDIATGYQYGFLYGIMIALALYNLVLYIIIRHREFGLYSLYLIGFVLNSLSYTGQLHVLITQDFGVHFQDWMDNFLMMTYSVAGLHFARTLLRTGSYSPKLDALAKWITIVIPVGVLIGFVFDQLVFSLILAFILNSGFATLFVAMGVQARKARVPSANLFLFSSVTAAVCIGISTMAVAGLVPYNTYTFKAIEVGMTFEAIMLSVILARIFRMTKLDLVAAEKIARTDSLTNVRNRRGFESAAQELFFSALDNAQDISIALVDIDSFKQINDEYGHSVGDEVIKKVAETMAKSARKSDLVARWGGEEFIMMLPDTSQPNARLHAERLRASLEGLSVLVDGQPVHFTVSIGVAGTEQDNVGTKQSKLSLEQMIKSADAALYKAKGGGRNQVVDDRVE